MTNTGTHMTDLELADLLDNTLSHPDRKRVEQHIASCNECLIKLVSAYEAVNPPGRRTKNGGSIMKRINIYLILAVISFIISFAIPRYFIQSLVATLLLGIKWIVDSKANRMLITIHEAWKKGASEEASRTIERFGRTFKSRV